MNRPATVLAVDGGNSKTDLVLGAADGAVLAAVRGPGFSPQHVGVAGCLDGLGGLYARAVEVLPPGAPRPAAGVFMLAGLDLPLEEREVAAAIAAQGWVADPYVCNDTFAVLRAGTDRGWGVAVVCGAGINCAGVAADGRVARFLALGDVTGDWGGGYELGLAALGAAVRAYEGRGPQTVLSRTVPSYFGLADPAAVAVAVHLRRLSTGRLTGLAPVVFAAAGGGDPVAEAMLDRLGDEVVAFVRAAVTRLALDSVPFDVVLGGGLMRAGLTRLDERIDAGVLAAAPAARIRRVADPPVVGAALLALDRVGAGDDARARMRSELAAVTFVEHRPGR